MDIMEVGSALSNQTRVRLIGIVGESGPISSKSAHEEFVEKYEDKRRESIYKSLESLVDAGILTKFYDRDGEGIVYDLEVGSIIIDLIDMDVVEGE